MTQLAAGNTQFLDYVYYIAWDCSSDGSKEAATALYIEILEYNQSPIWCAINWFSWEFV